MHRLLSFLLFICSLLPLCGYTPPEKLNGPVKSIRTYKVLLHDIPAGTTEEPWLPNFDFDEQSRPVSQWFYEMGQISERYEFRYEKDGEGRERTTWVTYCITPDLRPPFERLSGYEHWYSLEAGDKPDLIETRFETVQNHPVKSVYRYYDGDGRLVKETDTMLDLDVSIGYDEEGRLIGKRGFRGDKTFWEERYLYDEEDRLVSFIQTDLNRQLYERGEYTYEDNRTVFSRYVLDHPVTGFPDSIAPLDTPVFQSIKDFDDNDNLIRLRNYNWNGPVGLILTQEQLYFYNENNRLIRVEEPHSREAWTLAYDDHGNWITLTCKDDLNHPGDEPVTWKRVIEYYE